jgi:hypothetical protein
MVEKRFILNTRWERDLTGKKTLMLILKYGAREK